MGCLERFGWYLVLFVGGKGDTETPPKFDRVGGQDWRTDFCPPFSPFLFVIVFEDLFFCRQKQKTPHFYATAPTGYSADDITVGFATTFLLLFSTYC